MTPLILTSDDSILAVFDTYALFEKASGAKLNQSKSKGLWLGGWCGRTDPPVALDWSSTKLKILGVFLGMGNLEEDNWHPRIDAVDRVLKSWRSRVLSFRSKALVINALALSRVWYLASLIHMLSWVLKELSSLAFSFFWSGKRELVSRSTVVQCSLFGGFAVVDVRLKVLSLLGQWVRHFVSSPSVWVSFMSYWFSSKFDASPFDVLSSPIALGSCHRFTNLSSKPGVVWTVPSLPLVIRLCMGLLHVLFLPLFLSCLLKLAIIFCFLRIWSHRIVFKSLSPRLVSFIGLLRGALSPSLIWTVKLLT